MGGGGQKNSQKNSIVFVFVFVLIFVVMFVSPFPVAILIMPSICTMILFVPPFYFWERNGSNGVFRARLYFSLFLQLRNYETGSLGREAESSKCVSGYGGDDLMASVG